MIRLVTFDFWDTLVTDSPENLRAQRALRVAAIRRALDDAGAPVSETEAEEIHERSGVALAERFWSLNRDPSPEEQLRIVLDTGRARHRGAPRRRRVRGRARRLHQPGAGPSAGPLPRARIGRCASWPRAG